MAMTTEAQIALACQDDVAGILDLQCENLPDRGGASEFTLHFGGWPPGMRL
jgi:hypothetical protein